MSFNSEYQELRKKRKKQEEESKVISGNPLNTPKQTKKVSGNPLNDIAPVRVQTTVAPTKSSSKKNESKLDFFKTPDAFKDGYDIGDITKTILGTASDIAVGSARGLAHTVEGVGDLINYGIAGVSDMFGADDFADSLRASTKKDLTEKLLGKQSEIVSKNSVLGRTSQGATEMIGQLATMGATGGLASLSGLGKIGSTILTTGVLGTSATGSGMSEAYQSGATDEEALTYGVISGTVESISEMIFGGLGKSFKAVGFSSGLSSADDIFAKKLTSKLTNQIMKNCVEYGVKAGAEGFEEVLAGLGQAVGKKLTYMSEEDFAKIVKDENLLEQWVIGTIGSGFAQSVDLYNSNKSGTDFVSGLTQDEQSVVDKEVENRVAEKEADGKKLTNREKNKIYDAVIKDLDKGYISTDTIEEVLGGETYKSYKDTVDKEDALYDRFEKLGEKVNPTLKDQHEYSELAKLVEEHKNKSQRTQLKSQLSDEVFNLAKNSRLVESYNEVARRGQTFEADLSKYDAKQQEVVKKAVESGILNNTNRTHEFVDMVAKISADKGVLFEFANNEKIKESGFAVDGKTVNGYKTDDGNIAVNIDSKKALNSVVGHEITHILEGTELYSALADVVQNYATTKGEYQERMASLRKLYTGVYKGEDFDQKIREELTADIVGDYLFTDTEFINRLSTENRNVFQKIYDEIKYLCKIATAGSKEARELEKVKRAFEKAYKESANTKAEMNTDTKHSLSAEQEDYFKDSVVRDDKGNLKVMYHGTSKGGHTVFDTYGSNYGLFGQGSYFTDNKSVAESYTNKGKGNNKQVYETYLNITNPLDMDAQGNIEEWQKAFPDADFSNCNTNEEFYRAVEEFYADQMMPKWEVAEEIKDTIAFKMGYDGITHIGGGRVNADGTRHQVYIAFEPEQIKNIDNIAPTKDADIRYSLTDIEGKPIEEARITTDESDVKYSLSANPKIAKGQSDYIANHKAYVTKEELAEAQRVTNAMVDVMMKYSNILPEDKIGKVLTKNGSYDRSVENTTICVRTLAYNEFVDKVQEEVGRPLTQMESFLVSQKLYDIATEPQCLYCYVSLDRKAFNDMLLRYMQDRDTVIAKYNNSDKSQKAIDELYKDFLNGRKDTKPMKDRFKTWLGYVDNGTQLLSLADISTEARQSEIANDKGNILAEQLKDARKYAQSASWSKIQKNYVAYRDEILRLGNRVVKNLNEHYGLRWYSFSDYSPAFIVENMQQITDASIRGLKGLSYTKDTDFAEVFAPSGMNINISVFVNQDADGNFFIDEKQSANFERAKELREKYPNVGIVATVTNDDALKWAGSQEWSDVIIPFHIVRTGTDVAEYYKWLNYTSESADTIKDKDIWNTYLDSLNLKSENARKKVSKNIYPNEHNNDKATYLALCESRGLSPRFVRFAGEDWYMKLVNETRLSANESSVLKPVYDLEKAQASFEKFVKKGGYEGGWYKNDVDVDAEAKIVADDVLAGKKANEVNYGRQDGFVPESLIAKRKKIRTHSRYSLSEEKDIAPTFYSQMGRVVDDIKQDKIGASSVVNYLKGKGVKNEEIKWSGIEEFVEGKKSVTKQELQEFVANSMLQIEENQLGGHSVHDLWKAFRQFDYDLEESDIVVDSDFLENMENYLQEALDEETIDQNEYDRLMTLAKNVYEEGTKTQTKWHNYRLPDGENYRELIFKLPKSSYSNQMMRTHWGEDAKGVLAHARVQDFTDTEGDYVLFIEEIQSDWHNEGAKKGYTDKGEIKLTIGKYSDDFIPQADIKDNYGETVAEISKVGEGFKVYEPKTGQIWEVDTEKKALDVLKLVAKDKYVEDAPFRSNYHEFVLKNLIREATEKGYDKIAWTTGEMQEKRWSSDYAEGYRIEYDQDIPKFLNKYGKKWGAKVGKTSLSDSFSEETYTDESGNQYKSIREWYDSVMDSYLEKDKSVWEKYISGQTRITQKDNTMKIVLRTGETLDETLTIDKKPQLVHSMNITDSMKNSVLYEGQPFYSLSREGEQPKEYGNFNTYAKDILLQPDIAPVVENAPVETAEQVAPVEDTIPDGFAPISEAEANAIREEGFNALDDMDAPIETSTEPYYIADTTRLDDKTLKNISSILKDALTLNKAETKAIQDIVQNYSTSETQNTDDLFNEIKDRFGEKAWTERNEEIAEVKQTLRNYKLWVSPTIKGDIADYSDFMRRNFGKIRISKEGTPVDTAYMELSATYPEFFPPDVTNATDQLLKMSEVANMDINEYLTEMLDDETIQEATDIIADIVNTYKENAIREGVEADNQSYFTQLDRYFELLGKDEDKYESIKPRPEKLVGEEEQWAKNKMARADKVKSNAEQQTAKIITNEPKTEKKKNRIWSKFVSNFVDKASPFETLALKTGNREVDAKFNTIRYAEGKAQNLIGKGTEGVKALNDIIADVERDGLTDSLYEYLYHKHNVDRMTLEDRYEDVPNKAVFGDSVTAKASQDIVDQYEFAEPKLVEYANEIYNYNRHLRKMLVNGGVISQETADLWEEMYPHYVPIRRVGDEGLNVNVPLDTGRTGVNAPIKRATGGSRDILPLFDTMAQRTIQTYKAIAKNRFGVELKNTLGTTVENAETNLDEVIDSIDTQDSLLQEGKNGRNPTFTVFENGEKVTFEITEEMYDALKPTSEGLATTVKPLKFLNDVRRGLITEYNPAFMLTNPIKDSQDVLMNSQHPVQTYKNFPKAIKELATKNGRWYNEYMENGGEQNTYFEKDTNTFKEEKTGIAKLIRMPLDKIGDANNFIERIPRLAEYIASREAGRSIDVAMLDSARVTTNFSAGGDVTKLLNRNGATFLNASVQGAVQQVRNVREAKYNGLKGWTQLVAKTLVAGLPAMLLNGLLWDDDEEYEELSDYVKENYYIVAKFGDGQFVRIPKGRTVAVIQNAFEQVKNALTGDDEVDLNSFLELAISNLAPNNPLDNNIIAPITQVAKNETWYGEDLVPSRLQDLPNAEQYDESTDSISKWLGEKLNYSPYKINYLLDQYSGGIGDMVLPMLTPEAESGDNSFSGNLLAPIKDKFTTDSVMNNQAVSDFYETSDELTTNAKSSKATDEDILKYKYFSSVQAELGELYAQKREVQNSNLSDDVKYRRVRNIQEQINMIAENSLNTYGTVNIDRNYANVGDKHYHLNDENEWQKINDKQLKKQREVTSGLNITPAEYWNNKTEYDYAYESPEKYAVAKAVGGYSAYKTYSSELYDIKADKDSNGKSISGSRKAKVLDYINNLDIDYYEKIILFKSEYNADDTYNYEIIEYLDSRNDISWEEEKIILTELGFKVRDDGYISW